MKDTIAGALPIIVTNYARTFGVNVRMQGSQAYTDGKQITIPRLNLKDPVKARLAYGYLAHEAAHLRYSDFESFRKSCDNFLFKSLVNILEDARVERLIGSFFIGVWENLELLNSYDEGQWEQYAKTVPSLPVLQVLLSFVLCFAGSYSQRFAVLRGRAALLYKNLRSRMDHKCLRALSRTTLKVVYAKSTEQCIEIATQIIAILNTPRCFKEKAQYDKNAYPKRRRRTQGPKMTAELWGHCYALKDSTDNTFENVSPLCNPAATLSAVYESMESARDDLGTFEVAQCSMGRADFMQNIEGSSELRRRLLYKIRTYVESLGGRRRAGRRINPYKAVLSPLGEEHIFYERVDEEGMSTSVHLLVDVSGSMLTCDGEEISRCEAACRCALSLAMALDGADGIVPMCSFFPGIRTEIEVALSAGQKVRPQAAYFDQKPRGSTPLAQALWHAAASVKSTRCKRHIVLVLTDGIPDSVKQARLAYEHLIKQGIEVYGIGIRLDFIKSLIPDSRIIKSPSELDDAMFSLLERVIVPEADARKNTGSALTSRRPES